MSRTSHSRRIQDQEDHSVQEPPLEYGPATMAYLNGKRDSLMSFGPDEEKRVKTAIRLIEGQGLRGIEKNGAVRDLMRATWKRNIEDEWPAYQKKHFPVSRHTTRGDDDSSGKPDGNESSVGCFSALAACYKGR